MNIYNILFPPETEYVGWVQFATLNKGKMQSLGYTDFEHIEEKAENLKIKKSQDYYMAVPHIDFWHQHLLTIEQASAYFCIGENKMRAIVEKNPKEPFILRNGTRTLIKKELFGQFIDKQSVI